MTDAELFSLAQTEIELIQGNAEWAITVLTGYLLIAYAIGKKLHGLQVAFVNIVFIVIALSSLESSISSQAVLANLISMLNQQNPEMAIQVGYERIGAPLVVWLRPVVSIILLIGALAFMWNVRRSKAE